MSDDDDDERRPTVDAKAMREALAKTSGSAGHGARRDSVTAIGPLLGAHETPRAPSYSRPEPKPCSVCGTVVAILVSAPGQHKRSVCALCQGKSNRDRLNALRDAVRTLKESDDANACRHAIDVINRLDNQPKETIDAVRAARGASHSSPKSRKGFL